MPFDSDRHGRMTGKCYIVISGYCDVINEILGVFTDLDAAINYANFIYCDMELKDEVGIVEAEFDKVSSLYDAVDDLDERADVFFM